MMKEGRGQTNKLHDINFGGAHLYNCYGITHTYTSLHSARTGTSVCVCYGCLSVCPIDGLPAPTNQPATAGHPSTHHSWWYVCNSDTTTSTRTVAGLYGYIHVHVRSGLSFYLRYR